MKTNRKSNRFCKINTSSKEKKTVSPVTEPFVKYPLQYVQIDSTILDIIVTDEETGAIIGRPWLTVGRDVYSRAPWGFYLSFSEPDVTSLRMTVYNGICNKEELCKKHGIDPMKWNIQGIPDNIFVDNGKEFISQEFKGVCNQLGISIMYRPIREPRYGNIIERYIDKINILFRKYSQSKMKMLTLNAIEGIVCRYFSEIYLDEFQSRLNSTPRKKWLRGFELSGPQVLRSLDDFKLLLPDSSKRIVTYKGIIFNGLEYWGKELIDLIGNMVSVKYDPRCLLQIYVKNEKDNEYLTVKVKDRYIDDGKCSIWEFRQRRIPKKVKSNSRLEFDSEGCML